MVCLVGRGDAATCVGADAREEACAGSKADVDAELATFKEKAAGLEKQLATATKALDTATSEREAEKRKVEQELQSLKGEKDTIVAELDETKTQLSSTQKQRQDAVHKLETTLQQHTSPRLRERDKQCAFALHLPRTSSFNAL